MVNELLFKEVEDISGKKIVETFIYEHQRNKILSYFRRTEIY